MLIFSFDWCPHNREIRPWSLRFGIIFELIVDNPESNGSGSDLILKECIVTIEREKNLKPSIHSA